MKRRKSTANQEDRKAFYHLLHRLQKVDCDAYEYLLMIASDMRLYNSILFDMSRRFDSIMLWEYTTQGWEYWNTLNRELD